MSTVIYSFLTKNRAAIDAFIEKAVNKMSLREESNHVKLQIYQEEYGIPCREKYTGFEKIKELDEEIRHELKVYLGERDQANVYTYVPEKTDNTKSFREALKEAAEELMDSHNILYLSGGADSEVTALAFIDAKVPFTPVIFSWLDANGEILNAHDTVYAMRFCELYELEPVLKAMDIESWWKSNEIYVFANKYSCSSPQILTYHKMVSLVDDDIANGVL